MRSLRKHSNMFSETSITETYLFGPKHWGGGAGKTNWPKKIYICRVIFKIPGLGHPNLVECSYDA